MAINIVVIIKKNEVYLYIWMYSKIQSGYEIKIKQIDQCLESEWEDRERYWISYYKKLGFKLLNVSPGGKGVVTKEMRELSSIQRSVNAHKRPIYALDDNLNIVYTFGSIREAARFFNLNSHSTIGNALSKMVHTKKSCGYFWVYKEDYDSGNILMDRTPDHESLKIPLYQFDIDGKLAKKYSSIAEFLKVNNICNGTAVSNAARTGRFYLNSYWSFTETFNFSLDSRFRYFEIDVNNQICDKFVNYFDVSKKYGYKSTYWSNFISNHCILENGNKLIKNPNYK